MKTLFAYLFLVLLALANWLALLLYGFGMEPQNWWVIIGCGIIAQVVLKLGLNALEKEDEK